MYRPNPQVFQLSLVSARMQCRIVLFLAFFILVPTAQQDHCQQTEYCVLILWCKCGYVRRLPDYFQWRRRPRNSKKTDHSTTGNDSDSDDESDTYDRQKQQPIRPPARRCEAVCRPLPRSAGEQQQSPGSTNNNAYQLGPVLSQVVYIYHDLPSNLILCRSCAFTVCLVSASMDRPMMWDTREGREEMGHEQQNKGLWQFLVKLLFIHFGVLWS